MRENLRYSEFDIENNRTRQWWHHRWVKIIGISIIVLTIFAVTRTLVLELVILTAEKPKIITTTTDTTTNQQSEWTPTGSMIDARQVRTASVLTNGNVLFAAGYNEGRLNSAELYDPLTGIWTTTASMNHIRWDHTASTLTNGKVLVIGGIGGIGGGYLTSVELYDPSTTTWTTTASMNDEHRWHTASVLRNGRVLITAGYDGRAMSSAELY